MELKIQKLNPNAVLPLRATPGSAGLDLFACIDEPITVEPHKSVLFPTGLAIALPDAEHAAFIFARSGLASRHGLAPVNCVGVIDSDYRGEIKVGLLNQFDEAFTVMPRERIAQLVIMPVTIPSLTETASLDETARGEGGFGSTGR